jgi:hypothetical protein
VVGTADEIGAAASGVGAAGATASGDATGSPGLDAAPAGAPDVAEFARWSGTTGAAPPLAEAVVADSTCGARRAMSRSKPQLSQKRPVVTAPQSGHGVGAPAEVGAVSEDVPADDWEPTSADRAARTAPSAAAAPPIGAPHSSQ